MNDRIRILIADDHLIVREGLRLILETQPGFEIVAEARDGVEAIELATELQPDLVLMDLRMPRLDGIAAIETLRTHQPEIALVILTTYDEDDLMRRGLAAGARGYLLKDTDRETLFATIRAAVRGDTLLKPEVIARLITGNQPVVATLPTTDTEGLTDRELEVLNCVAAGDRNKQIAHRLGITERTVKAHLTSIYQKLAVDSRAAAVSVAMQHGLLSDDEDAPPA
ncbi:MAG: response regulator transcription factor [Anaerolineales bacterium]|nr:response regulator transcription factor [Anaerolineales bacterium]